MKRILGALLAIVCLIAVAPMTVYATTFNVEDTNMSFYINEEIWYVFTRDNIQNNPELDELGFTYEKMHQILEENNAYVDAAMFYENGEFVEMFVRIVDVDTEIINLADYEDKDIAPLAQELIERQKADTYYICETNDGKNKYKFINIEYVDEATGFYIWEFMTVINQKDYTITFQSNKPYSDTEYSEMESIIGSISFKLMTTEEVKPTEPQEDITTSTKPDVEAEPIVPVEDAGMSKYVKIFLCVFTVTFSGSLIGIAIVKNRKKKNNTPKE